MSNSNNRNNNNSAISIAYEALACELEKAGLVLFGVVSHTLANEILAIHSNYLENWQANGYAANMAYMQRAPELYSSLDTVLKDAKSIVCIGVPYSNVNNSSVNQRPTNDGFYGRVARFAWGLDYHDVIRAKLKELIKIFENKLNLAEGGQRVEDVRARVFTDAVPLLEKAIASASGGVVIGKHSLAICPKYGSFLFLAEIVWNVDVMGASLDERLIGSDLCKTESKSCFGMTGNCSNQCMKDCPTEAIVAPYVLDAKRCISYLTIEKDGILDEWERTAIGEWLFGCDICQEVCPHNSLSRDNLELSSSDRRVFSEFSGDFGVGKYVNLEELLHIRDDVVFNEKFKGTPFIRAGREKILRNACCVLANLRHAKTNNLNIRELLLWVLRVEESAMIREQVGEILCIPKN